MKKSTLHRLIFCGAIFVDTLAGYRLWLDHSQLLALAAFLLPVFLWNVVSE